MIQRSIVTVTCLATLVACATTSERGWTGSGAQPFDAALADCQAQVSEIAGVAEREPALIACLAA